MTSGYSAPNHSGTRVPYEMILRDAWLAVRWTDCALLDPARLKESLYPAFERTFTHAEGIFNAHCRMASSEMQDAEIARMVQTVGGKGGAHLGKAAAEAVGRYVSAARD